MGGSFTGSSKRKKAKAYAYQQMVKAEQARELAKNSGMVNIEKEVTDSDKKKKKKLKTKKSGLNIPAIKISGVGVGGTTSTGLKA